eukprot:TRINITY_DN2445_c0_g1_i1.p1 TRINITY_DN2445_c0_g1~~TRINITY_DN2445_c0_g1_i1.p1  ORF type:complete len:519 (-),score=99.77 TRINITY_DN2445_c0_g1_i1:18-1553(-)
MKIPSIIITITLSLIFYSTIIKGESVKYPIVYEISTRPWLYELSVKYGTQVKLVDVPVQEFLEIQAAGYNTVWLMGMWHLGEAGLHFDRTNPDLLASYAKVLPGYTMDDIIGSPYAVTQYVVNPEIGTFEDLAGVRKILNSLGMKLMLDFVPNHSATDASWVTTNMDYYVRAPKGMQPPFPSDEYTPAGIHYGSSGYGDFWKDTCQFNYWNMDLKAAQIENIKTVASFADYIRCDMAHLLLNDIIQRNWEPIISTWGYQRPATEFWADAISEVKSKFSNVTFLAEVYYPNQQALQNNGFDYTYDKQLYDRLVDGNLDNIRGYISGMPASFHQKSCHFVENHDEPRAAAEFGSNMRADGAAMVSLMLPGMRLVNQGQEYGLYNRLDIHLRRSAPEGAHPGVRTFYQIFIRDILDREVFHTGSWEYLKVSGTNDCWRLMSWKFETPQERALVVINYSDQQGTGNIVLRDAPGNGDISMVELFSNQTYVRSASTLRTEGLFTIIQPWSSQVFLY